MVDHLTSEQRRRCMQANKSKGTKGEALLCAELWGRGIRYRRNMRGVPGTPDICFKSRKVAVFVDGEFWHGKNWETDKNRIHSNREFWYAKIERNRLRDQQVNERLDKMGWRVIRFWDNEVKRHVAQCADLIEDALRIADRDRLHRIYFYDTRFDEMLDRVAEDDSLLPDDL